MLREKIKSEIDKRGWSISKLSEETGIRYPSLTEYLKGNKDLEGKNIEKIIEKLFTLKSNNKMKSVADLAQKFGIKIPLMITSGILENENFILKDYTSLPPFRQNLYEVKDKKTGETRYFAHDTENSLNYPGYLNIDRNPIAEILEYVQLPKSEEHTTKLPKKYLFGNIPFVPKV